MIILLIIILALGVFESIEIFLYSWSELSTFITFLLTEPPVAVNVQPLTQNEQFVGMINNIVATMDTEEMRANVARMIDSEGYITLNGVRMKVTQ